MGGTPRPSVAVKLSSWLFHGSLSHLRWSLGMAFLVSSCVWMRQIHAHWLWLLQGLTPAMSMMGLAWVITSADKTGALGWLALPAGIYSAAWGSVAMTALYAVM